MQNSQARRRPNFLPIVWEELLPYPGRLDLTLRMAVLCVLVTVVSMANQVPEAALSCYLIFFASKDNSGSGILIGIGLIIAASVGILLGVLFLMISADAPFLRLAMIAAFTFGGMYFSQASKLGPMAGTVGFVFAFVMTIYDIVPIAELLTRALTWMWVVVFFPMFFLVLVNVVAPRSPRRLLQTLLGERLDAAAAVLLREDGASRKAEELLGAGNGTAGTYQRMARLLSLYTRQEAWRAQALVDQSYRILALSLAATTEGYVEQPELLARRLRAYAAAAREGRLLETSPQDGGARSELGALLNRLGTTLWQGHTPTEPPAAPRDSLLKPDAFTNPAYTQFALKTLLAVMVCYITYTALDWFEIHTAMITCFYVALGTTGETVHKLTLRIVGCLIGAAMGVFSIIFFMPHMTDIGHLVLLIGAGSFIAAWISNGSERISYMGWQAALAFFLCTLGSFHPSFDLAVATNRIIGILFGNVVVTVIFSNTWPVSVGTSIRAAIAAAGEAMARMIRGVGPAGAEVATLHTAQKQIENGLELLAFEADHVKKNEISPESARAILGNIKRLSAPVLLLSEEETRLRRAPKYVKAATVRFESAVGQWLEERASAIKAGRWADPPLAWEGGLDQVEAAFRRARRQASTEGKRLPASVRDEMAFRLEIYRQIDDQITRMAR